MTVTSAGSREPGMWLTITSGVEQGTRTEVTGERFVIGRDDSCNLVLDDEKVSRQHAFLEGFPDGRAVVHDLGSSNGTYVNGRRIEAPVVLEGQEHLRFGDTVVACSLADIWTRVASAGPQRRLSPATPPLEVQESTVGRSTVQRLVRDALETSERSIRRSVLIASALGALAIVAAATVGALAAGTIGGGGGTDGPPIAASSGRPS